MLKGIPRILSPELMKILMEMGHGDEIVLADANFPAASHAQQLVRCDGHGISELLEAILPLFPIDTYVEKPIALMDVVPGDSTPVIWQEYENMFAKYQCTQVQHLQRNQFYVQAKQAYAIVATGETAAYGNVILKKGVV